MSTLSDRLKSLGVKVGAGDLPPPRPKHRHNIDQVLAGRWHATPAGDAYIVDYLYPSGHPYGRTALQPARATQAVAEWAGEAAICECEPQAFAYIDIETTGLAGGTGTYAFLIGAGRFEADGFRLAQFFMRDPIEEPAQLLALEEFLGPCQTVITYNGKAFDVPLLTARFTTQGWKSPFSDLYHVDLLHLARKLWRDRLPSRTLGNVETFILGARRTEEDVPGWMIPQIYFDYLHSGDVRPLKRVFYHNEMDVLSMAALLQHVSHMLTSPAQNFEAGAPSDLVGMGRLFEDLGRISEACALYRQGLESGLPEDIFWGTLERLSFIYKRSGDWPAAVRLWEQAAAHNHVYAHVELAKYYEHQARQPAEALHWTLAALHIVTQPGFPPYTRRQWLDELEHRLNRLKHKGGSAAEGE